MASAQNESDEEHDSQHLRIVLLGVSGAGKSPTANAILGREAFTESRTRESEIKTGVVEDRNISIIDTPGFFSTHLTDEEMKKQMMKSLYLAHPGPHVFLLVIKLETFREEQRNMMEKIQENFGEEALRFTMVLFVGREKVSRRVLNQIIESEKTQKILNYFKGRFYVINSKNECDSSQITKLLKSIDEMVKNNGEQHYSNEIYLKNMRKLRDEERMKQAEMRLKQEEVILKQEQAWKRHMEMKKLQEDSDTWKQKGELNQEEEIKIRSKEEGIKDDNERIKEDASKKKTQYLREDKAAVQENLRTQMESRREKERQRWKLQKEMTQDNPSKPADLRIIILGKTDAGKTATANTILGRDVLRGGSLSGTLNCEKQESVVSGRSIAIIDTPGLLDAPWYRHFQHKLKRDIEECLDMSAPGPHVFLLVIRLIGRSREREQNTVKWIQENFGEDAVRHTIVLFTHVDLLKDESLDQYVRKNNDLQSLIDSCGGRFHSFNNQNRNNQNQVTELLEKIEQLIKDNGGEHYANKTSEKKKPEDRRLDNSEEATEKETELRDHLFRLMMGLELSEMALRLSLERAMAHSNLSKQDLRIVLLGLLSTGKSSAGNTILGRDVFQASPVLTTESCEKQTAVVTGRTVSVIDTPGLLDYWLFMDHNQSEIEKSLGMSAPGPHVFLLVLKINVLSVRKNAVKWFQENLEKDVLNHTIVLFTHADWMQLLMDEPLNEYIEQNKALKSLIDSCGGRYHSFDNEEMQNRFQVLELLMKIDKMLERNGGRHYTKQNIFKRAQRSNQASTKQQDDAGGCEIQ